jgi:nickel-dependent lactate racemase
MDIDLYQSHKAVYNAARAAKRGGAIALVSECKDGIGPSAYYQLLSEKGAPKEVIEYTKDNYRLGCHKAASFAEILDKTSLHILSRLPDETISKIGAIPCYPEALRRMILVTQEEGGSIVLMPEGSLTVPRLHNAAT